MLKTKPVQLVLVGGCPSMGSFSGRKNIRRRNCSAITKLLCVPKRKRRFDQKTCVYHTLVYANACNLAGAAL